MRQNSNIFNLKNVQFVSKESLTIKRNQTYRIRVVNGIYESAVGGIAFLAECNIHEEDWLYDFDSCKRLNFSIIGADSQLFDQPIHNVNTFDIFSGERYDVLIIFDGHRNGESVNPISED